MHAVRHRILNKAARAVTTYVYKVRWLQDLLSCWNQFLLLERSAISVLQNSYKLPENENGKYNQHRP